MGGVGGHMSHLYENPELTFKEMKDVFAMASNGELEGTEKTDGQNLFISYSVQTGRAKAARNKGNIKSGGMTAEELAQKFAGRGALESAFVESFKTFEKAVQSLDPETQMSIFGPDANIYYNAEIQDPRTANVINYDTKTLNIHQVGHAEFDKETGTIKDVDISRNVRALDRALKQMQEAIEDEEYNVQRNAIKRLRALDDDTALNAAVERLESEINKHGISDKQTIADYQVAQIAPFVEKQVDLPEKNKKLLLKRIFGVKGVTFNNVVKGLDKESKEIVRGIVKSSKDLLKKSNYQKRKRRIIEFNKKNTIFKKGISITPVKFGISFTTTHLNQGGALVHIYTDGSVHLNHGGIEMGQGLMTKISQIAANELGLSTDDIKITSTDTEKVPNTSASAASASTDINGAAVVNAINKIKNNLAYFINKNFKYKGKSIKYLNNKVLFGNESINFKKLISLAHLNRISLSSSGFYKTPKVFVNKETLKGRPFLYFSYGAAVSEVIIDTLTGENKLLQVDIIHDVGKSINPSIDLGQIEGGFVQGLGWLTTEQVSWNVNGNLTTYSPSTYKIPVSKDIPEKFNVNIYEKGLNIEKTVNRSKAVGEPPLMLALSTFMALKNAVNNNNLKAPATPENILMALQE